MVKKIVDEHGARIELVNRTTAPSSQTTGACVTIVFRRLAETEAKPAAARRVA